VTSRPRPSVAAAIDIGSNSIKMTIGRENGAGGIDQVDWASEVVRLGQGIDRTGRIDADRMEVAIESLTRFAARARELGATRVLAVATEATRSAANGTTFLDRVRQTTGIDVRVVDGQEEAELTFRGLATAADVSGSVVVADIGGGSTELIVARDGVMLAAKSLEVGSGRLTERHILSDPPSAEELVACEVEADSVICSAVSDMDLPTGANTRLIVVGGTGEFMARLVPDGSALDLETMRHILTRLAALPVADLAVQIDIPEARARVLPAGVAIVAAVAARIEPDRIEISHSGIRNGLLLEAFYGTEGHVADNRAPHSDTDQISDKAKSGKLLGSRKPKQPELESSFRETMKTLIAERWAVVWDAIPAALEGTDVEGVHDVRVASRRLRAAMDVSTPAFPRRWYKPLHRAAKDITSALGEVRDRDVLLEALRADRPTAPLAEHPGIDRLIDRVESERAAARAEMERFLKHLLTGQLRNEVERRFGTPEDRVAVPVATDEPSS
jgi:hypothetical protein